jgi:hypothetical protein
MGRWLRRVGIALLCSLLAGFAFGTCVRLRAERPTVYIGALEPLRTRRTDPAHPGGTAQNVFASAAQRRAQRGEAERSQ